jgi:uncharacterized protein
VAAGATALLLTSLAVLIAGCRAAPPVDQLTIAGGGEHSVYQALGNALAGAARQQWGIPVQVMRTAAAEQNVTLVATGRAQLGFARVDVAALAIAGDPPFPGVAPVMALAGLYDDYVQVVVRADSGIQRLADLAGRTVSIDEPGSGTEVLAARLFQVARLAPDAVHLRQLPIAEAAGALRARRIDAFIVAGGVPMQDISRLAAALPVRLLSLAGELPELQRRYGQYYQPRSIPAGTYRLGAEVQTIGILNILVVSPTLPDETAYRLTELLFAARADLVAAHPEARRLDSRAALETIPIDLHPGAVRYYQQTKPMAAAVVPRPPP